MDGECKIYNNIQERYIRYKLMRYLTRYMLRWYVLILICNNKLLYKKMCTIFSALHVTKLPQLRYNNMQKVCTNEEGRTTNMITTANCIEGTRIRCIFDIHVKICLYIQRTYAFEDGSYHSFTNCTVL